MINNLSIFRYEDAYAVSVARPDGGVSTLTEYPSHVKGALSALFNYVESLKSPAEVQAEKAYKIAEAAASDEQMLELFDLAPEWVAGEDLVIGQMRKYGDTYYRVVQAHTAQAHFLPDAEGVLGVLYNALNQSEAEGADIIDWFDPTSEHFYTMDQLVRYLNGLVYKSKHAANVWAPETHTDLGADVQVFAGVWELQGGLE